MKKLILVFSILVSGQVFSQTEPVKISDFLKDKHEPTIVEIFAELANFRDSLGLAKVQLNTRLCQAAQLQADWIAQTGLFQHEQTRVAVPGIPVILPRPWDRGDRVGEIVMAENLHTGWKFLPASTIISSWAKSKNHLATMLRTPENGKQLEVGLAIAHYSTRPNEIVVVLVVGASH